MTKMAETRSAILPSNSFPEEHLIAEGSFAVTITEACRDNKVVKGIMASMVQTIPTVEKVPNGEILYPKPTSSPTNDKSH